MDIKRKRTTKRDESNIRARLNDTLLRHIYIHGFSDITNRYNI